MCSTVYVKSFCNGILKQPMEARNGVGIGLLYRHARLHCKAWLGEIEQCNYNVSLLALLWSFRNLGVKRGKEEKFTKAEQ